MRAYCRRAGLPEDFDERTQGWTGERSATANGGAAGELNKKAVSPVLIRVGLIEKRKQAGRKFLGFTDTG